MTSQHAKEERAGIGRELQTFLCQKGTVQVASEQAPRSGGTTVSPLGYSRFWVLGDSVLCRHVCVTNKAQGSMQEHMKEWSIMVKHMASERLKEWF